MNMGNPITLKIKRFAPERDEEGHWQTFPIPRSESEGMTVVTALRYIQQNLDPSLAFFCSCELAQCRGCVMDINGEATFACTAPVQDGLTIEPLAHLPVLRDLVVKFVESEVALDEELCTSCEECLRACPMEIFEISGEGGKAVIRNGTVEADLGHVVECIGCRRCEKVCPVRAITVRHI